MKERGKKIGYFLFVVTLASFHLNSVGSNTQSEERPISYLLLYIVKVIECIVGLQVWLQYAPIWVWNAM